MVLEATFKPFRQLYLSLRTIRHPSHEEFIF
jgi:hypothetical protein